MAHRRPLPDGGPAAGARGLLRDRVASSPVADGGLTGEPGVKARVSGVGPAVLARAPVSAGGGGPEPGVRAGEYVGAGGVAGDDPAYELRLGLDGRSGWRRLVGGWLDVGGC